jgi:hypothetical protein
VLLQLTHCSLQYHVLHAVALQQCSLNSICHFFARLPVCSFVTATDSLTAAAAAADEDSLSQPLLPQSQAASDAAAAAAAGEHAPLLHAKEAAGAKAEAGR